MRIETAFKLFRIRKDGTLGSLFIDRRTIRSIGIWMQAEDHPTPGYQHRKGWHCFKTQEAPHLTEKGRIWQPVLVSCFLVVERPIAQGGVWYLAQQMKIVGDKQTQLNL